MDRKIRAIEKINRHEGEELKQLERMDKKRDKYVEAGKKTLRKKS